MQRIILIIFLFLLGLSAQAQEMLTSKKFDFVSSINTGVNTDFYNSNFSMAVTNGVIMNQRYMLSLGLGIEGNQTGTQLPMFFEGKYLFLKNRKKTPFISVTSGYLQPLYRNYWQNVQGGFTAGAQIGFQNFFSDHVGISTSVGYRYWRQRGEQNYYYYDIMPFYGNGAYIYISNRFEVRLALLFK
ncbi:hypothetical protein [Lishizhenia sp.]|uniref:hypothetical protein n=1 Tax=Lishizhenia sp. TaxID=2497594 RepID=UPI00299E2CA2|nr:hypothetical protein [Lishizhenia sp.]MDX1445293.1 hypothetical protein [Lishizhenia sp.]